MARIRRVDTLQALDFDALLDVRSPSEFAEDHIPGAINVPVLDDDERARVGTLYVQTSPFEARKVGAMLVSRNIAAHIERHFLDRPKGWTPLVYCWRGGQRSGAMAHILAEIGWSAGQLEGGYKAYRAHVRESLVTLPGRFQFRVLCGATGSGKSRLLVALAAEGAQVLDLEALASHRGSLLGEMPGAPQPGQKAFETRLWHALRQIDPQRPVWVEAESRKIGVLSMPDALLAAIRDGDCVRLQATAEARAELLLEDYAHFLAAPELLLGKLEQLTELHGRQTLERWRDQVRRGEWWAFVHELLEKHYDPAYRKSTHANFIHYAKAIDLELARLDAQNLGVAARALLKEKGRALEDAA
jgi:tRNA 2-selenouridine synthase